MERTEWAKRVRARAEELAKQHKEITAATEEVTVELAAAFPSVTIEIKGGVVDGEHVGDIMVEGAILVRFQITADCAFRTWNWAFKAWTIKLTQRDQVIAQLHALIEDEEVVGLLATRRIPGVP